MFAVCGWAQAADLVDHNGFQSCWSRAITEPTFLAQLNSAIDGAPACILANPGGNPELCTASMCAGNIPGCPITLHAGLFTPTTIDLTNGHGQFSGPGSIDAFSMSLNALGLNCTANISNIALDYYLQYSLQKDGNNGFYTTAPWDAQPNNVSFTVQVTGNPSCGVLNLGTSLFADAMTSAISDAFADTIDLSPTLGQSVCPVIP